MKNIIFSISITLTTIIFLIQSSYSHSFETEWLKDEAKFTCPKTNTKVVAVSNLWGVPGPNGETKWKFRYVGIEIPLESVDLNKIFVKGEDGSYIQHKNADSFSIENESPEKNSTFLKLYIEHPEGFKFKIILE